MSNQKETYFLSTWKWNKPEALKNTATYKPSLGIQKEEWKSHFKTPLGNFNLHLVIMWEPDFKPDWNHTQM